VTRPVTSGAYFPGDEPRLARLLDGFLAGLRDDLARQNFARDIRVLLLAGGYGRGEGGIFRADENSEPQLYNDLEFYIVVADSADAAPVENWCHAQAHHGEEKLGIEVEFKLLCESALCDAEPSMFFYDLLAAHRLVFGAQEFVDSLPTRLRDPALIPAHEAARLLFNRGTGLFFSMVALELGDSRVTDGFIERNHAKVRLALADAVLAVNGRHHFSCRERSARLAEPLRDTPPDWPRVVAWHAEGVGFKLHPRHRHPSREELAAAQREICTLWLSTFLWIEALRLGVPSFTAKSYAAYPGRLFPETKPARNFALHARDRLRRGGTLPGWFDYPRAALQRALVLALDGDQPSAALRLGLSRETPVDAIHAAYGRWWKFYN
jgi:hypothetical protein